MKVKGRPPRAPKKRASVGQKFLSLGAMLFAAALLVGTTLPANAFLPTASSVNASAPADKVAGQTLEVSDDALMTATARDTFDVISYADQLRLKYGNVSYSFSATTGAIRWPFPYPVPITDGFGDRPSGTSGTSHHNGVDFVPGGGTPIYAVADGIVATHSDDAYGYGNHVIISHDVNGMQFDSLYAHMLTGSSPLNAGDAITVGDFIGLVGDTGDSYGAHLHFEIRIGKIPVDPFAWLTANAVN
jgi:murein DD-endopeptidase MepM/ murein hydrolase activator NlpD